MRRLPSVTLRVRVLAAMLAPAILILAGAFFLIQNIESSHARTRDAGTDKAVADVVARSEAEHPGVVAGAPFKELLGGDQLIVTKDGRTLFSGPPNPAKSTFLVTQRFPGDGKVTIVGDVDSTTGPTLELTAVAGLVLLLAILLALVGTSALMRAIREPISRAVHVADRLAGGDLEARMGASGPDQFGRLARAFDGMATRVQTADRQQEQFLSDLAHEIATPVNGIIGLAGAALDHTIDTPTKREEAQALLGDESVRIGALLNDLRHLGSLSSPAPLDWQKVDIALLADGALRRLSSAAADAGLHPVSHVRPTEIISDPRSVDRIVTNLLTNAIRYTPAGGTVTLSTKRRHDEVVISVKDTGIGIADEDRDRIFDRFYRVDWSRDRDSGGTGLGLSIVSRTAAAIGGRIELETEPGVGSDFRLVLPVAPQKNQVDDHHSEAPPRRAPAPDDPTAHDRIAEGRVTDGRVTDGQVTDGQVTDGQAADR